MSHSEQSEWLILVLNRTTKHGNADNLVPVFTYREAPASPSIIDFTTKLELRDTLYSKLPNYL